MLEVHEFEICALYKFYVNVHLESSVLYKYCSCGKPDISDT